MSVEHEYAGFLDSKLLWNETSLFKLSQYNFQNLSDSSVNKISVNISENEVLGKRIEHFFDYFLTTSKNHQVLLKNVQIFRDKTTIGELDFLIHDKIQNRVIHIELIYKFYLYDPKTSNILLERWIGPNRKDSLLEKVTKLKEKQLPLLHRPETIARLQEVNINPKDILQKVCFFGNLFIPLSHQNKQFEFLNNDCIVGFWLREEEFNLEKNSQNAYYIPKKKDWIVHPKHNKTWHSFSSISKQISAQLSNKKSPLLWIKSSGGLFSKCFIVWW
ncbi:DUF1853 family protein [Aquimarina sp. M1]